MRGDGHNDGYIDDATERKVGTATFCAMHLTFLPDGCGLVWESLPNGGPVSYNLQGRELERETRGI